VSTIRVCFSAQASVCEVYLLDNRKQTGEEVEDTNFTFFFVSLDVLDTQALVHNILGSHALDSIILESNALGGQAQERVIVFLSRSHNHGQNSAETAGTQSRSIRQSTACTECCTATRHRPY
jgi:Ran GTPase-activating protein (RanGAP) involved in mRNA processing and transport